MIVAIMNAIYAIAYSPKIQDFNGVWTRDLEIPVRRSSQLSYESTGVGSWSFVGSDEQLHKLHLKKTAKIIAYLILHRQFNIWNISYISLYIHSSRAH